MSSKGVFLFSMTIASCMIISFARRSSSTTRGLSSTSRLSFSSAINPSEAKEIKSIIQSPVANKIKSLVYYGRDPTKPDQYRGSELFDPPKVIEDNYFWMRDETRKDDTVLNHIKAENAYCEASMKPLEPLQDAIYKSMLSRLKETDEDYPTPYGPFNYYTRTVQGLSYRIQCRKLRSAEQHSDEEVILDENLLAVGHEYSVVGGCEVSPCHKLFAYAVDRTGYEHYTVQVKDLVSGTLLPDVVEDTAGAIEWSFDSKVLFYTKQDSESRPFECFMHVLGTSSEHDILLLREDDQLFWMDITRSADERFLIVSVGSKETSESHVLDLKELASSADKSADHIKSLLKCVERRQFGVRYDVDSHSNSFLILTNKDGAKCNKLVIAPIDTPGSAYWKDVKQYDPSVQLDEIRPFKSFIVVKGRQGGLQNVWIVPVVPQTLDAAVATTTQETKGKRGKKGKNKKPEKSAEQKASPPPTQGIVLEEWGQLKFPEPCYSVWVGDNGEFDTDRVRLLYSSLITPMHTFDYVVTEKSLVKLKQEEVPNYDHTLYTTLRVTLPARDGRMVPVSLVFKTSLLADPSRPIAEGAMPQFSQPHKLLLYGYGSYGMCIDPVFDYKKMTLLDYGMIYAIAHIRGGGEMGRHWYEDEGKYLTKLNTFNDFADVAKGAIANDWTRADKMCIVGRSAGGLLVGAVLNRHPELFKCAVADVPFVDLCNSMSDPSIPLTVTEWEEWGNSNSPIYHDYMMSYSPYDNVATKAYPSILVTAGLNDPRVAYWEPLKWVAKLREMKTDSNPLYLKTDLSSGHFSASDRYKNLKETAFEYSFIVNELSGGSPAM